MMACGNCGLTVRDIPQLVQFRTARGTELRLWFCNLHCVYWGGVKYAKSAPTTVKAFRKLFPGAVEVVS
jgi:hypothetical protein